MRVLEHRYDEGTNKTHVLLERDNWKPQWWYVGGYASPELALELIAPVIEWREKHMLEASAS